MLPTSRTLIESIRSGLTNQVAPTTTDKVALSVLRSIDALLGHLAERVDSEADVLAADNADLRDVLGLEQAADESGPRVADLAERNAHLNVALDTELAGVIERGDQERLAVIDAYFARRLDREQPLVFPAFAGRTY